jgi:hypothetical protein
MAHYLFPPGQKPAKIAPTLARLKRGVGTGSEANGPVHPDGVSRETTAVNPTVVPDELLSKFHFTFLIRHPRYSIPSYYRCTIPPLDEVTGFYGFEPTEAGYDELRRTFDYLRAIGQIGPETAGQGDNLPNGPQRLDGKKSGATICVIDSDDLLDNPAAVIETFCKSVGADYDPSMLIWNTEGDHEHAREAFKKWQGFHEDAINSSELKPRIHVSSPEAPMVEWQPPVTMLQETKARSQQEEDAEWTEKYGEEGAKIIRQVVNANVEDYEYLKQFAIKVEPAIVE